MYIEFVSYMGTRRENLLPLASRDVTEFSVLMRVDQDMEGIKVDVWGCRGRENNPCV